MEINDVLSTQEIVLQKTGKGTQYLTSPACEKSDTKIVTLQPQPHAPIAYLEARRLKKTKISIWSY